MPVKPSVPSIEPVSGLMVILAAASFFPREIPGNPEVLL
jgi:hypothetical protein